MTTEEQSNTGREAHSVTCRRYPGALTAPPSTPSGVASTGHERAAHVALRERRDVLPRRPAVDGLATAINTTNKD